ncbi:MAG: hypothetical protein ABSD57_14595 [Verrucomicrobiota bacterium]
MRHTVLLVLLCAALLPGCSRREANTSVAPFEWLAVTNGETRQQVADALGAPVEQPASSVDVWRKGDSTLRVTYDENGRATNIWRKGVWTLRVMYDENERVTNMVKQTILK